MIYITKDKTDLQGYHARKENMAVSETPPPARTYISCAMRLLLAQGESGQDLMMAGVIRDLLPFIQQFSIARAEEVGIDTLAERMRDEITSANEVARCPVIISAWIRIDAVASQNLP